MTAGVRVARKRRLSLFTFLRALGFGDEEEYPGFFSRFVAHFGFLAPQWESEKGNDMSRAAP